MTRWLSLCCAIWAILDVSHSVSTKLDFGEEKDSSTSNTSKEDEDVEVKHTIVVSTKLKNSRRGLHSTDGDNGALTYAVGHNSYGKRDDNGEVPVIKGYKSVESTAIRTPDTRDKPPFFTDSVYISRNIRDDYDTYPIAGNPSQWKPSSFFNNVNWWNDDSAGFNDFAKRRDWPGNRNPQNFHRKITDNGVKEFYCRKCRELSGGSGINGCSRQRNNWFYESTTPKVKIDGKLAKFN